MLRQAEIDVHGRRRRGRRHQQDVDDQEAQNEFEQPEQDHFRRDVMTEQARHRAAITTGAAGLAPGRVTVAGLAWKFAVMDVA